MGPPVHAGGGGLLVTADSLVHPGAASGSVAPGSEPDSLTKLLEQVRDKGIVIAGDAVVEILDIELRTLTLRLFLSSADTARRPARTRGSCCEQVVAAGIEFA